MIKILHIKLCFESKTPIFSLNFSAKIFKKSQHRSLILFENIETILMETLIATYIEQWSSPFAEGSNLGQGQQISLRIAVTYDWIRQETLFVF
jgi:hypothetical protein